MRAKIIQKWILMAIAQVFISLVLIAIAPIFINSNYPLIGFLIWLVVLGGLGGSLGYAIARLNQAIRLRQRFITRFPEYNYLMAIDFLEIKRQHFLEVMEHLEICQNDPQFQELNISPLDLLYGAKKL